MTSIPRVARRLVGLSWADRLLFAWAFFRLAEVDVELRLLGFERLMRRAGSRGGVARVVGPGDLGAARERARWLEVASRHHFVGARCLHRSLALHSYLRGQELPSELKIGVRKDGGQLAAHAWVELGGEVVDDPATTSGFEPLKGSLAGRLGRPARIEGILGKPPGATQGDGPAEWRT